MTTTKINEMVFLKERLKAFETVYEYFFFFKCVFSKCHLRHYYTTGKSFQKHTSVDQVFLVKLYSNCLRQRRRINTSIELYLSGGLSVTNQQQEKRNGKINHKKRKLLAKK